MKVYIVCECLHYMGTLCSFDYISAMQKDLYQDNTFYKNKYIFKQLKTFQFLLYLLGIHALGDLNGNARLVFYFIHKKTDRL